MLLRGSRLLGRLFGRRYPPLHVCVIGEALGVKLKLNFVVELWEYGMRLAWSWFCFYEGHRYCDPVLRVA